MVVFIAGIVVVSNADMANDVRVLFLNGLE